MQKKNIIRKLRTLLKDKSLSKLKKELIKELYKAGMIKESQDDKTNNNTL